MALAFKIVGAIVVALGIVWAVLPPLLLNRGTPHVDGGSLDLLLSVAGFMPSLSVAFAGLLLIGLGGVLARLDRLLPARSGS
jgi:hypothetical protein